MTVAYATEADLTAFLPATVDAVPDAGRLLERASELLDNTVRRPFAVGVDQLPTDADVAEAMKAACCLQVRFWLDVGEEHNVEGLDNRQASIGHLNVAALPPRLAPEAVDVLQPAGLLSSTSLDTTAAQFFATQGGS